MSPADAAPATGGEVTLRYWAAAKQAAGVGEEKIDGVHTLAGLVAATELIEAGKRVILLDQEPEVSAGGQEVQAGPLVG